MVAARGQLGALLSENGDLARGEEALRLTYRQARATGLAAEGDIHGGRESAERGREEAINAGPAGADLLAALERWLADPAHAEPPSAGGARSPRQPVRAP
jgi:hypothetical protein